MNGLPYYKAYPRDFIEGTVGMSFELKAAYRLVLDLIYMQGGRLPDDPRYIAGLLGCSVKKWNSLRAALIHSGKIDVFGSYLGNLRADKELEILGKFQDQQREKASKPRKNKDLAQPRVSHTEPDTDTEEDRDTNVSLVLSAPEPASPLAEAVAVYNETAQAVGWPRMQKLTPARSKALKARLSDCGGISGWRSAMDKGKASDFLCGRTNKPWNGCGFDWITKQANFTKLMEGNYDNRSNDFAGHDARADRPGAGMAQAFAAVAARRSGNLP